MRKTNIYSSSTSNTSQGYSKQAIQRMRLSKENPSLFFEKFPNPYWVGGA